MNLVTYSYRMLATSLCVHVSTCCCSNLVGPSGLNQKYFDEAVQDGKRVDNSPTMKQHCDEDDDSGSKC